MSGSYILHWSKKYTYYSSTISFMAFQWNFVVFFFFFLQIFLYIVFIKIFFYLQMILGLHFLLRLSAQINHIDNYNFFSFINMLYISVFSDNYLQMFTTQCVFSFFIFFLDIFPFFCSFFFLLQLHILLTEHYLQCTIFASLTTRPALLQSFASSLHCYKQNGKKKIIKNKEK